MGSAQQITLGFICLAAAFIFGNYVSNHPLGNEKPFAQDTAGNAIEPGQAVGNVQSRLVDGAFDVIEKRPASIATMRNPLNPRFSMPPNDAAFVAAQSDNPLPPPSQLAVEDFSKSTDAQSSTQSPNELAEAKAVVDVPDFTSIAAEFKNTPIELPPLGSMPVHSNQPRKQANHPNNLAPLNDSTRVFGPQGAPIESARVEPWNSQPAQVFSANDFAVSLKDRFEGPSASPVIAPTSQGIVRLSEQPKTLASIENLPAAPTIRSNHVVSKQPLANDEPGGISDAYTFDAPPPPPRVAENQPANRVRTRLPFGLNDQARNRLATIQSNANSRIALNTTKFVEHVIQPGESLQSISKRYFGNPDYYLDIYLANRSRLRNPADAPVGTALRVPVYE